MSEVRYQLSAPCIFHAYATMRPGARVPWCRGDRSLIPDPQSLSTQWTLLPSGSYRHKNGVLDRHSSPIDPPSLLFEPFGQQLHVNRYHRETMVVEKTFLRSSFPHIFKVTMKATKLIPKCSASMRDRTKRSCVFSRPLGFYFLRPDNRDQFFRHEISSNPFIMILESDSAVVNKNNSQPANKSVGRVFSSYLCNSNLMKRNSTTK